jgi:choline-glycine betaine transporter
MIGQFTARFVSGIRTWQLFVAMLVVPSIAIGIWFTVLYHLHAQEREIAIIASIAMIGVGVLMVVNSLDSLIRLYTDNLGMTAKRLGPRIYFLGNVFVLSALTLLFRSDFLRIQWVGALVIAMYFGCFTYIVLRKWGVVAVIRAAPPENTLDFHRIEFEDSVLD